VLPWGGAVEVVLVKLVVGIRKIKSAWTGVRVPDACRHVCGSVLFLVELGVGAERRV
jgi:hypothetical protein